MHIVMHGIKFTINFGYSCMLLHVFSLIIWVHTCHRKSAHSKYMLIILDFMFISTETPFNSCQWKGKYLNAFWLKDRNWIWLVMNDNPLCCFIIFMPVTSSSCVSWQDCCMFSGPNGHSISWCWAWLSGLLWTQTILWFSFAGNKM